MLTERTYEISDIDGTNKRTVTVAQYRVELAERAAYARPIMDAFRRNDIEACGDAQAAMRKRFAK